MSVSPIQLGVIGCGGYALQILKRIWSRPFTCQVAGVVRRPTDIAGARACAQRGIPLFDSVDELLEFGQGRIDAVFNPTPIHLHRQFAEQCLAAGFPVFMEKPPVATVEDHLALVEASRRTGLPVAVCFNAIYAHSAQQLKMELLAGRYGRLLRVRNIAGWIRDQTYYQRNDWAGRLRLADSWILDGTINNPLSHAIAAGLHYAGELRHEMAEPHMVEAELYRANAIESEDTSSMRIVTRNGVEIISNLTLCAESLLTRTTVLDCEDAVITISELNTVEIAFTNGAHESRESYCEDRIDMLESLCQSLRNGSRLPCDIEGCLPFTRSINAAFHSSWPTRAVPAEYLRTLPHENSLRTQIIDINNSILGADRHGQLLSEAGIPWATAGRKISLNNVISASQLPNETQEAQARNRAAQPLAATIPE